VRDRPVRVAVADVWGGQIGSDVRVGVDRAAGQGGIEQVKASAGVTDGGKVTDALASAGAELVITSTLGADIPRIATSHPDTRFFAYADDSMPAVANVTWASFADQQTAYLAGAAAAMASRSGRVGFLGGADTPTLRRFEAGYVAGAHSAVPTVAVEVDYITHVPDYDGFSSPSLAADAARRMLQHGTDVVYAASGASQTGTFQAVIDMSVETHHQLWAIGADDDAWGDESWQRTATSRDHILTSTVKRFDLASYEAVQDFKAGTLQPGLRIYDVANGGLVLSVNGGHLDPYLARLNEISHSIVTGQTVVPCVPSGLSADEAKAAQRGVACGLP
jgi:basic membrane protein A